jgi:outer membrane protein OmpA-like peptidoglycan-associated protein
VEIGPGGVSVQAPEGGNVQVGPEGVSVEAPEGTVQVTPGEVSVEDPEGTVQVGPEGVTVEAPEGNVQVQPGGVRVQAPGGSVQVGPGGVSVQAPGSSVQVHEGGVTVESEGGQVTVSDRGVSINSIPVVQLPEITAPGVEVHQDANHTVYNLQSDILFDFDRADLRPGATRTLRQVADSLKRRHAGAVLLIEGHTDSKGSDEYNLKLSLRRAETVRRWLAQQGKIPADRLQVRGYGETRPVAPNARPDGSDDPQGRQRNRRVEITVVEGS